MEHHTSFLQIKTNFVEFRRQLGSRRCSKEGYHHFIPVGSCLLGRHPRKSPLQDWHWLTITHPVPYASWFDFSLLNLSIFHYTYTVATNANFILWKLITPGALSIGQYKNILQRMSLPDKLNVRYNWWLTCKTYTSLLHKYMNNKNEFRGMVIRPSHSMPTIQCF